MGIKSHCEVKLTATIISHLLAVQDTLENSSIPSVDLFYGQSNAWKFMQDGAPAHRANSIKSWFEEKDIELLPRCTRSPDLNSIESIWSWMDR